MTLLLNYAPPKARRRWPRWIGFGLLLLAALGAAVRWGPGAWDAASLAYAARQCRQYVGDPEQVVLESDPKLVPALLTAHANDARWAVGSGFRPVGQVAMFTPECWSTLARTVGWNANGLRMATLFLHEMRAGNGESVLVHVGMNAERVVCGLKDSALLSTTAILRDCDVVQSAQINRPVCVSILSPAIAPNLRVYAGQIDPSDPSHFTIRYRQWDQENVVDGYLEEPTPGSYRVRYSFRNPPRQHVVALPGRK